MKKLVLCILLVGAVGLQAAPDNDAQTAIRLLFSARIDAADSIITNGMKTASDNPEFFFLKAHHAFYSRYFSPVPVDRDSMLQIIVKYAEKAVELGKKAPQSSEMNFYIGSAYGLLSRAYIMQQELWKGYWAASDCENYLETVLAENPNFADAYVGLGVLEYYPAQLAGFRSFLAWLGGFGGDSEKGLRYFRNAAENGQLLKTEAQFILATMNRFVEVDFRQADKYFTELNQQFPENVWISNQYRQTQLAFAIERDGVDFFIAKFDSLRDVYSVNNSNVLNGIGYNFMGQQRYEIAEPLFKLNLSLYPDQANPYDSISECYENMGDKEKSISFAKQGLEKLKTDTATNEAFRNNLKTILEDRIARLN